MNIVAYQDSEGRNFCVPCSWEQAKISPQYSAMTSEEYEAGDDVLFCNTCGNPIKFNESNP